MKPIWLIASLSIALISTFPARASTYFYEGSPYTTNGDPTDFGDRMTGSVTFSCNPCADGNYNQTSGVITNFQLRSGIFVNTISQYDLIAFLIRSNAIVEWQAFPFSSTGANLAFVGSTDPAILADLQAHAGPPPSTGVGDLISLGQISANNHTSGSWSSTPPAGAAMSDIGTGMPALAGVFGVWAYWRHRVRRADRAVPSLDQPSA
jgi:hypothetical protein